MSNFADDALAFETNIRDAVMERAGMFVTRAHMRIPKETNAQVCLALRLLAEGKPLPENPLGKILKDCIECHVDDYELGIMRHQKEKLEEKGVKTLVPSALSLTERNLLQSYILWMLLDDLKRSRTGARKADLMKAEAAFQE